jgi:uncharacterized protein (TIGR00297 family)
VSDTAAISRFPAGLVLAVFIAGIAYLRGSLSRSGVIAAVCVATACVIAGWSWAILLIAFFVTSTALSGIGRVRKRAATGDVVEKGVERDAVQVLANGGVYASLAIAYAGLPQPWIKVAAAAALAASTADTWATEIGTLSRYAPRDILSFKPVAPGTSGGVTLAGTLASLGGAIFIAVVVMILGWPRSAAYGAVIGGFAGSVADSLLGSRVQERMWCPQCERGTERAIHSCGTITVRAGGVPGIENDMVNFLSSIIGAVVGSICIL